MSDETENTVGDMMQKQNVDILKMLTYTVGAAVYVAGVVYAETHGFSMLSNQIWSSTSRERSTQRLHRSKNTRHR